MSFFEHQSWLVTTLSPVHLGTGQDYESTSYVIDDGVMYAFSENALFKALSPQQLTQISNLADKAERGLFSIHKLLCEQREVLKPHSKQLLAIGAGVERFYGKRMNENGKNFNQMLLPKTAAECYSGRPYIPGTAIKGAIRTALMNKQLLDNPRLTPSKQVSSHDILSTIHNYNYKAINEDPFKALKVTDATGCSPTLHKKIVLVNSQHWDDAKKSKAVRPCLLESIAAGQLNAFCTDLRLWPAEKGQRVAESTTELVKSVNQFYLKLFKDELSRNSQAGYYSQDYSKASKDLLSDDLFAQALASGSVMLLRVGKFSGAASKTLEPIRSIKIIGQKGAKSTFKPLPNEQRLVASSENGSGGCEPLGWIVLTQPENHIPALERYTQAIYAQDEQLQRLTAAAADLDKKRQEYINLAQQKAEAAELAAIAEAEKAQKLAAMSESELVIFQLRERVERGEGKGAGPGHHLWTSTKEIVASCHLWQEDEKRALCLVVKEAAIHLGIDWKKNDKAKAIIKSIGVSN